MLTLFYEIVGEEAYFERYGCEGTTAAFSVHELEIMAIETYLQQHPNEKLQMASFLSQINTTNI